MSEAPEENPEAPSVATEQQAAKGESPEPAPATPAPADAAQAPAPAPMRRAPRRMANPVAFMGRMVPRASTWERGFWSFLLLAALTVLALSATLDADNRGIGTHEQLGFPPCGFVQMFGGPCPSCGFTTTFTLAAHLRPIDALVNQPFGLFLFVLTLAGVIVMPVAIVKKISLMVLTERWPWWRIGLCLLVAWLVCWAYKWNAMGL